MKRQIDEGFCGPAVLQHFLNIYGHSVSQNNIADILGGYSNVKTHGVTTNEMAVALNSINPDLVIWEKENSTWRDAAILLNKYSDEPAGNGVVINIQGIYVDADMLVPGAAEQIKIVSDSSVGNEPVSDADIIKRALEEDNGHFIVVTNIYDNGQVRFLDPSFSYPRILGRNTLSRRWWEVFETQILKNVMLVLVKKGDNFPSELGFVEVIA